MAKLTEEQKAELAEMTDDDIDLSDIPERDIDWSQAQRGTMYQPVKQEITLTIDEYVIEWFDENEPDETARHEAINKVLLDYIMRKRFPNWGKAPEPTTQQTSA